MKVEIRDKKVYLDRSEAERSPLVHSMNRIEGQIRGIRVMIEEGRYCGDELQQIKAVIAALNSVARTLVEQHVAANVGLLSDADKREVAEADLKLVLQRALGTL